MSNLAHTYGNQGQWSEAEQLHVKVLERRKVILGEDHPDTLSSMNNLANTYGNQGQWSEAEQLQVKGHLHIVGEGAAHKLKPSPFSLTTLLSAIRALRSALNTDTLTSMNNLAQTYGKQGQWSEAEQLQVKELEAYKV
ncbi:hypothetical protein M422DRAFT_269119 [Sphaerobolus stellatus SS14]|uniref:Kinesin light chain n=1 Tax=Sphaerobolus stellatus (strain SS14) TaxID=990650 RepID=A0A0C9UVX3_SPHS4|nr:hypothetical protein M422DRAFT_269119 [Sphaerobolus stellatus SS14]